MEYQKLTLKGFIDEVVSVTNGAHPRKFCFILGAGASKSSGIKSGQDLVKIWDNELRDRNEDEYNLWRASLKITDSNMSAFYSQYYEKRFHRCPMDGYNYIEKIMESAKPSAGYVMLSHLLTHTPHRVVITTNFDHLTEDAVNYYAQVTPLVIGHESLSHYISAQPERPTVIKIHRDLLFDPKSSTKDLETLPENWKKSLSLIFENYHPIFLGYAGNDKSLMDFLVVNGEKFANDEWKYPYWMLYEGDKIDGKVNEFLKKSRGYYITHSGFDDVMIRLGAAFDYKSPSEEEFLEDAKKRYKTLSDAIASLAEGNTKKHNKDALEGETKPVETIESQEEISERNQAIEKIVENSDSLSNYRKASMLISQNNCDEAIEIIKELLEKDPKNARYHRLYSEALERAEKHEQALEEINIAIELEPENEYNYYSKGSIYESLGEYTASANAFATAVMLAPDDKYNRYRYSDILTELGRYEEAIEQIQAVISAESDDEYNYFYLGDIYYRMGKHEESLLWYQKAVSLAPNDASLHYFVACTLERLDRKEEALNEFTTALRLEDENDDELYWRIASLQRDLGRYEEALNSIEAAIELNSEKTIYHSLKISILQLLNKN